MTVTNLTALFFTMGFQGGTIHQAAERLGVTVDDIIAADYETMGDLLRMAQRWRRENNPDALYLLGLFDRIRTIMRLPKTTKVEDIPDIILNKLMEGKVDVSA